MPYSTAVLSCGFQEYLFLTCLKLVLECNLMHTIYELFFWNVRSLPELSLIKEFSVRGFTYSSPKLNALSDNSVCCSQDGEIVMVHHHELPLNCGSERMFIWSERTFFFLGEWQSRDVYCFIFASKGTFQVYIHIRLSIFPCVSLEIAFSIPCHW